MNRLLSFFFGVVVFAACGGAEQPAGPQPVDVGEWCEAVGASMCRGTADKCFSGMSGVEDGCRDSFTPSCMGNRDAATPSGRTSDDLGACVDYIESRSCEQLGQDTGQALTGSGSFAQLCILNAG